MAGISHASFQQKNYLMVYHILHAYFTQPRVPQGATIGCTRRAGAFHRRF